MSKFFYLTTFQVRFLIIGAIIAFFALSFFYIFAYFIFAALIFYFYRRDRQLLISPDKNAIYSPITGKILNIHYDNSSNKIFILMEKDIFAEFGLSIPMDAEVLDYQKNKSEVSIIFQKFKIILCNSFFHFSPSIWIRKGDRGIASAKFGYVPFKKIIRFVINDLNVKLCVISGDKIIAGQTIICNLQE